MAPNPASKTGALRALGLSSIALLLGASVFVPSVSAIQQCSFPASLDPGVVVGSLDFSESNYYVNFAAFAQIVEITTMDVPFLNAQVQGAYCGGFLFNCTSVSSVLSCYVPSGAALWLQNNFAGTSQYVGVSSYSL